MKLLNKWVWMMARAKYNHKRFYLEKTRRKLLNKWNINNGQIITFPYPAFDKRPLVFVMDTDEYVTPRENRSFSGINLNYLPLHEINKFFIKMLTKAGWESDPDGFPKVNLWEEDDPGIKPVTIYKSLVKNQLVNKGQYSVWRTYKYDKVKQVEHVNFKFNVEPLNEVSNMGFKSKISKSTMYRKLRKI